MGSTAGIRKKGASCQRLLGFGISQGSPTLARRRPPGWAPAKRQPRGAAGEQGSVAGTGQHSRGEGVQATGSHLQQAVPPVRPGHTEIVHGAPKDPEGGVLQHKVLALGVQPGLPLSQPGRDEAAPVQPTERKGSRSLSWPSAVTGAPERQAPSPPSQALSVSS